MSVVTDNQITRNYLPQGPGNSAEASKESKIVSKDQFLKLLIAQMKYQDPLNPMKGTEFTAQLAQFTSLEQLYNLNTGLSSLKTAIDAQSNLQAASLIGKQVRSYGDTFEIKDGTLITNGAYALKNFAAQVQVKIYDPDGNLVAALADFNKSAGQHKIEWDGQNIMGVPVADGQYTFEVSANDENGETMKVTSLIEGRVTGLTFNEQGVPILLLDDTQIKLADVVEITERNFIQETEQ